VTAETELDDRGWPIRTDGWQERLIEKSRALFAELAERYRLQIIWDEEAPVEVCCTFPKQEGLDFELSLTLQGDELTLSHDWFWADLFPGDRPSTWTEFELLADGMLSGEARALVHHCGDPEHWYKTEAQIFENGQWRSVSTGIAPWRRRPFRKQTEIIQNKRDG
jgi:hypothetical protein